jgi:hypothetical protein
VPLDYFMCDKSKLTTSSPPFTPQLGVPVVDRFGSLTVDIKKAAAVCNPANVNNTRPGAQLHVEHGVSYQSRVTRNTLKFVKVLNQKVMNTPFGTTFVDVKRPARLFVPSAESLVSLPAPLASPYTDHLQCYKISKARGSASFVEVPGVVVVDQFESFLTVTVRKPSMLCVPVNVNGAQPGAENPAFHPEVLLCYKVKRPQGFKFATVTPIFINNELGPLILSATKTEQLCVPSLIVP